MRKLPLDKTMAGIIAALLLLGLGILSSASISLGGQARFGSPYHFVFKQIILGFGAGAVLFYAALKIKIQTYRKYASQTMIVSMLFLLLVFVPGIGVKIGGVSRWVSIIGFSFQPSEILKITFVLFFSAWLSARRKNIKDFKYGFLPFLVITGIPGFLLFLEPDIGSFGVIAITALGLYVLAGGRALHALYASLLGILGLGAVSLFKPYLWSRLFVFLHPGSDPSGIGYQIMQSLIAIGSGGISGVGWGLSRQKFQYLPEPAGDAIFAIFAEEFGFIGSIVLIGLFMAFFVRGMIIASHAKNYYAGMVAAGITILVVSQAIINIGAVSGVLPLTGLTLPFVSYGGSAMAILLFEMGILLNISRSS